MWKPFLICSINHFYTYLTENIAVRLCLLSLPLCQTKQVPGLNLFPIRGVLTNQCCQELIWWTNLSAYLFNNFFRTVLKKIFSGISTYMICYSISLLNKYHCEMRFPLSVEICSSFSLSDFILCDLLLERLEELSCQNLLFCLKKDDKSTAFSSNRHYFLNQSANNIWHLGEDFQKIKLLPAKRFFSKKMILRLFYCRKESQCQ